MIRITETIRDAFQGIKTFIPTKLKIQYAHLLLQAGFDVLDVGSFVSPKLIPQMVDTPEVLENLQNETSKTQLMVLVVNLKGLEKALQYQHIKFFSYPYSVSPTFLKRNLNAEPQKALQTLEEMIRRTKDHPQEWVVYLSMALGNPYGDPWHIGLLIEAAERLHRLGVRQMPLSDILGIATPDTIFNVYAQLIPAFPEVDFGLHLHTKPSESFTKLEAAWEAGVKSFETVLGGLGGCPTAANEMVGNLNTLSLLQFCEQKGIPTKLDTTLLGKALTISSTFTFDMHNI